MVGKKSSVLVALLLAASILGGCSKSQASISNSSQGEKKIIKIGINQIVEHPALDASRKGFIEALKSKGFEEGKNLEIDFQNAQGEPATSQTIAQGFVSKKVDLILAIATPSAQASFNTTKNIPILITAVTDPVKAGLVKSMDKPDTNVTGTSDNVPIEKQFELLKQLIPNSKKIGIVYNTSEANSEIQVEAAKKAAPDFGIEVITVGVTNVNELPQALSSLLDKIDVLYVPTDNLVVSAMPLISSQCFKKSIPIIGSERGQVESGALATNGKSPKDIPITTLKDMQLVINTDAAKKLNINIPENLNSKAEKITGGVQ